MPLAMRFVCLVLRQNLDCKIQCSFPFFFSLSLSLSFFNFFPLSLSPSSLSALKLVEGRETVAGSATLLHHLVSRPFGCAHGSCPWKELQDFPNPKLWSWSGPPVSSSSRVVLEWFGGPLAASLKQCWKVVLEQSRGSLMKCGIAVVLGSSGSHGL